MLTCHNPNHDHCITLIQTLTLALLEKVIPLHRAEPGKPLNVQLLHDDVDVLFTGGCVVHRRWTKPRCGVSAHPHMLQLLPPAVRAELLSRTLEELAAAADPLSPWLAQQAATNASLLNSHLRGGPTLEQVQLHLHGVHRSFSQPGIVVRAAAKSILCTSMS